MYKYRMTPYFDEFIGEAKDLFYKHREEINLFDLELDIDWDTYKEHFNQNSFLLFEKRFEYNEESELVGYCGMFMYENLQHKTSLQATQEILFIDKEHRGYGIKFLKFIDDTLKKIGVETVLQRVPAQNDWGKILERIGYHKLETVYSRRL